MRGAVVLWGALVTHFEAALEGRRQGRQTSDEAGEALGISGRQFRRLRLRQAAKGEAGLTDRWLGRVSVRRGPVSELARMQLLYREEYVDFPVRHFHEQLRRRHGYTLGYTVTGLSLQSAGLVVRPDFRPSRTASCTGGWRSVRATECCCRWRVNRPSCAYSKNVLDDPNGRPSSVVLWRRRSAHLHVARSARTMPYLGEIAGFRFREPSHTATRDATGAHAMALLPCIADMCLSGSDVTGSALPHGRSGGTCTGLAFPLSLPP
jgi:hypothetical protein